MVIEERMSWPGSFADGVHGWQDGCADAPRAGSQALAGWGSKDRTPAAWARTRLLRFLPQTDEGSAGNRFETCRERIARGRDSVRRRAVCRFDADLKTDFASWNSTVALATLRRRWCFRCSKRICSILPKPVWMAHLADIDIRWKNGAAVCVVLASKGYPEKAESGKVVTIRSIARKYGLFPCRDESRW